MSLESSYEHAEQELPRSATPNEIDQSSVGPLDEGEQPSPDAAFEAEPFYQQAALTMTQELETANKFNDLASLYKRQGKYVEAEQLYQQALTIWEQEFGPEHSYTAAGLNNLAELYKAQRKYAEAEPLYQRTLTIWKRELGPEHPHTASVIHNLAQLYMAQERYTEAEPLFQHALAIRERKLGTEHPNTADTFNDLAGLYLKQGNYIEAELLLKRVLSVYERRLGPKHLHTATGLNNLAELYKAQKEYAEAEPLYQRALSIYEQQLGLEHSVTATILDNLVQLYKVQERYTEAELLLKRVLPIYEQRLEAEHPFTQYLRENYASLLQAAGYDEKDSISTETEQEELQTQVIAWLQTPDWDTSRAYLQVHPLLLTDAAEQVLEVLKQAQEEEHIQALISTHQRLLQEAHEEGIEAAYERFLASEPEIQRSNQEQERLLLQLDGWMKTPNWEQSQMYLETHPDLLSDIAEALLTSFLHAEQVQTGSEAMLRQHQQLLRRTRKGGIAATYQDLSDSVALDDVGMAALYQFQASGQVADLNRAMECWREALNLIPFDSPVLLGKLGSGLRDRYLCTGELADLETGISVLWQAVQSTPPDSPRQAGYLANLGGGLHDRYLRTGELADLNASIITYQRAVQSTSPESPDWPLYLNNLGSGLRDRYLCTGELADLEASINASQQAVQSTPLESPNRSRRLNTLSIGLRDRYEHTGVLADLDAAVSASQQAVQTTLSDSPYRPVHLSNLGGVLHTRYERTGALADLNAAISASQQAVQTSLTDSSYLPSYLNNLGNGLNIRYKRTGALADLEAAISASQQAVQISLPDSLERSSYLNNLGSGLRDRYERTGNLVDLNVAISASQQAVQTSLPDSPQRPQYLTNLGSMLNTWYTYTGELTDLEAAIKAYQQAVQATSSDSPSRPALLNNLGWGLHTQYTRTGKLDDLEAAINIFQQAVQATPSDSPNRPTMQNNLGTVRYDQYTRTGKLDDLEAAISIFQQAVQATSSDSPIWSGLLNSLGWGLYKRYTHTGEAADLDAAIAAWEKGWFIAHSRFVAFPVIYQLGQQRQGARIAISLVTAHLERVRQSHPRATSTPCRVLEIVEGSKSRLLTQLVGRGPLPLPGGLSQEIASQEQHLLANLTSLDTQELAAYGHLALSQEETTHVQRLQQRQVALHELEDLWDRITRVGPEGIAYVALRRGVALTWQELASWAKVLGPTTALLSFFTTTDRALLFLLRAGWRAPRVVEVSLDQIGWANLRECFFREVLSYRRSETWDHPLRPLFTKAQHHLRKVERLVLAPEGIGHLLPWGVLAERAGWRTSTGQPLPLVTLPALGVLPRLRQREHVPPGPALVVGNPRGDLPHAEAEANAVAERFGTKPLLGTAATKSEVLACFPDATLIHLATHAFFDADNPLESGIVLADGVLTAREVLQHRLQADLLVLSACESGQVGSLGGEELAGLSQAFLQAGVRSLLVSLWKVNDPATAALTQAFYTARQAGSDKALALRQAMTQIQQNPRWAHSYYWGAFVLLGDWD